MAEQRKVNVHPTDPAKDCVGTSNNKYKLCSTKVSTRIWIMTRKGDQVDQV